jgi:hypothetical protein
MASLDQLARIALVERASDEEDNVIDHVTVGNIIQEGGERLYSLGADVMKLGDKLLGTFFCDSRGVKGRRLVLQKFAIIRGNKVKLHIVESLALAQIDIIRAPQNSTPISSHFAFQVPVIDVEHSQVSRRMAVVRHCKFKF